MKTNNNSSQQVNPALLVILGLVLVGVVIYQFVLTPKASPTPPANPVKDNVAQSNNVNLSTAEGSITESDQVADVGEEKGNPFLVPMLYRDMPSEPVINNVEEKPTNGPVLPNLESKPKPKLGAILQKRNDKVALIYYGEKGYILRERDLIPGSNYRVSYISKDRVSIVDETGKDIVLNIRGDRP